MPHNDEVKKWIALADNDLKSAEHLAKNMYPPPHEIVCFHCQQFVEKYLKAFLVSKGQEPPYIHDLVKLTSLCEAENPLFSEIKHKCVILTEYGVQPRYPSNMQINQDDMNRALRFSTDIMAFMLEKVPELFGE